MNFRGVRVKIVDVSASFVSFKYESSNARSRVKRRQFVNDYQNGKIEVTNPSMLDK